MHPQSTMLPPIHAAAHSPPPTGPSALLPSLDGSGSASRPLHAPRPPPARSPLRDDPAGRPSLKRPIRPITPAVWRDLLLHSSPNDSTGPHAPLPPPLPPTGPRPPGTTVRNTATPPRSLLGGTRPLTPAALRTLSATPTPPRKLAPLATVGPAGQGPPPPLARSASSSLALDAPRRPTPPGGTSSVSRPLSRADSAISRTSSSSLPTSAGDLGDVSLPRTMCDFDLALRSLVTSASPLLAGPHLDEAARCALVLRDLLPRHAADLVARGGLRMVGRALDLVLAWISAETAAPSDAHHALALHTARIVAALASANPKSLAAQWDAADLDRAVLLAVHPATRPAVAERLLYALGEVSVDVGPVHDAVAGSVGPVVAALANAAEAYLAGDGTIRLFANLLQSRPIGAAHAHDARLAVLVPLLSHPANDAVLARDGEDLELNALLLLNNLSYYCPPAGTDADQAALLAALADVLLRSDHAEAQAEALGVAANLARDPHVQHTMRGSRDWMDLLVAMLESVCGDVLLPLCGVWINLVGGDGGAGVVSRIPADSLVDILTVAVQEGHQRLLDAWSKLVLNAVAVADPGAAAKWLSLAHADEMAACLDEAATRGDPGPLDTALLEAAMDAVHALPLAPAAEDDDGEDEDGGCDLEPLPSPPVRATSADAGTMTTTR
ncbi:hypothetical protein H9P43_009181 [Blastocladiella emersonii ATCC 22665]|nr:hypothetical protein H9P43_009181 [Blastocladiella emersonii ATCC 22665]